MTIFIIGIVVLLFVTYVMRDDNGPDPPDRMFRGDIL